METTARSFWWWGVALLTLGTLVVTAPAAADQLVLNEIQVTDTPDVFDSWPRLGSDGITDIVVFNTLVSVPNETPVTDTPGIDEIKARLGNDGITDIVVVRRWHQLTENFGEYHIVYQRLIDGVLQAEPLRITDDGITVGAVDISGDHIVYAYYPTRVSADGALYTDWLDGVVAFYQISTGTGEEVDRMRKCRDWSTWACHEPGALIEQLYTAIIGPAVDDSMIVYALEPGEDARQVCNRDLTIGYNTVGWFLPAICSDYWPQGPIHHIDIGEGVYPHNNSPDATHEYKRVVWNEEHQGQLDLVIGSVGRRIDDTRYPNPWGWVAIHVGHSIYTGYVSDPNEDEIAPTAYRDWVVWQQQERDPTKTYNPSRIYAIDSWQYYGPWPQPYGEKILLADVENAHLPDGADQHRTPTISGDLVSWESDVSSGNTRQTDVYVHRLSTSETFRVTPDSPGDDYQPQVFGNQVVFRDTSVLNGSHDIYVTTTDETNDENHVVYQRLRDGALEGAPVQITNDGFTNEFPDLSGDYIVYASYPMGVRHQDRSSGSILAYQISTGTIREIGPANEFARPKIERNIVAWKTPDGILAYRDLTWPQVGPRALAGPTPSVESFEVGDRFIAWGEVIDYGVHGKQIDLVAYELATGVVHTIANDPVENEWRPSTDGPWIVWQQQEADDPITRIEAYNFDTQELLVPRVANGAHNNVGPTVDGDLVAYDSDAWGTMDAFLHKMSLPREMWRAVPTNAVHADQFNNHLRGDLIAYVDTRNGIGDIYVSQFEMVSFEPCDPFGGDVDRDEDCDIFDNCVGVWNPGQEDSDGDGTGDACERPIADAGRDPGVSVGDLVTLDGSGSFDPDDDYPLTFAWTLVGTPTGSAAALVGADTVSPTFTADLVGTYTAELVVTDSGGDESAPDQVTVSTINAAPVAEAGPDQSITVVGTVVYLDGSQSWDPDGDDITYTWFLFRPTDSNAALDDPSSPTPSFTADIQGEYTAALAVSDGALLDDDTVLVTFANVAPVADAGNNQTVGVGDTVALDGTGSSDANGDPLTYLWSLVSAPAGSTVSIQPNNTATTSFVPDENGSYVISLVVNDGLVDSAPGSVTITATATSEQVIEDLVDTVEVINGLDDAVFKNKTLQKNTTKHVGQAVEMIDAGDYEDALSKLEAVLRKTDGCAMTGAPDPNDWIEDCAAQAEVYPLIVEAIDLIEDILGG